LAQGYSGPEIAEQLTLTINSSKATCSTICQAGRPQPTPGAPPAPGSSSAPASSPFAATFALAAAQPGSAPRPICAQQITQFFGREAEIPQVKERLAEHRLGDPHGLRAGGQTRLSLRVAEELLSDFQDGIWVC